jgi:hypothetical protein
MEDGIKEYSLTSRAKLITWGLLVLFGGPMLYAAWLQFEQQEPLMGGLMLLLLMLFAVVLLVATGYCIRITETSLQRLSPFGTTEIAFEDVDNLHFGSGWTNFHVSANGTKIFVSSDFKNREECMRNIVDQIDRQRGLDGVSMSGKQENLEQFLDS